jgi:hypothetical protein
MLCFVFLDIGKVSLSFCFYIHKIIKSEDKMSPHHKYLGFN